jgi:hypothetical protein
VLGQVVSRLGPDVPGPMMRSVVIEQPVGQVLVDDARPDDQQLIVRIDGGLDLRQEGSLAFGPHALQVILHRAAATVTDARIPMDVADGSVAPGDVRGQSPDRWRTVPTGQDRELAVDPHQGRRPRAGTGWGRGWSERFRTRHVWTSAAGQWTAAAAAAGRIGIRMVGADAGRQA